MIQTISRSVPLIALSLLFVSCGPEEVPAPPAVSDTIEVLGHDNGKFTVKEEVTAGATGNWFMAEEVKFAIAARWPHAETTRSTTNESDALYHGVELAWTEDGGERTQWVYQTDSDDTVSKLEAMDLMVRVTPPGARPPMADEATFAGQVQILRNGNLVDLPAVGEEVFEGWLFKGEKMYQHAVLDEEGNVTEAEDGGFTNRVYEVYLADADGTEEKHIAFLDHPEITRGIHPTILPVSRTSGEGASLSRLVVCITPEPVEDHHLVHISPGGEEGELAVRVWPRGAEEFQLTPVSALPAKIDLGESGVLHLKRHFAHAKPQVKWEKQDLPENGEATPALLIEHRQSHHQKSEFVLIEGEVTPCRIGQKHLMLRYRVGGK